jgi:hypothetical protein
MLLLSANRRLQLRKMSCEGLVKCLEQNPGCFFQYLKGDRFSMLGNGADR